MTLVVLGAACAAALCLSLAAIAPAVPPSFHPLRALQARRARAAGEASVTGVLEALVASSRAGLVLPEALAVARDRARGELAARLDDVIAHERLGAALADALAREAVPSRGATAALLADLELCARSRLPSDRIAAFLDDALGRRRFERELASDLRARTAGQRFQVWLLAAVVPGLALYLAAMSPTLAGELATPLGRYVLLPAGALFEIAGVLLSRRVVASACR